MEAALAWKATQAEIQSALARGEPIEAMKLVMHELRRFSESMKVHTLHIDTSNYYSNPAAFGTALKAVGTDTSVVDHFAGILAERGTIFMRLSQPARALPDLEASVEISSCPLDSAVRLELERARAAESEALAAQRRAEEARKVPVTILTGFLGAGKTTLLNHILTAQHHGRRYAVIENEVGKIGIDNRLLADPGMTSRTEETITLLDNGCLCCTVRSDLIGAVKQILDKADALEANRLAASSIGAEDASKPPLDGILIETTGLADPGPVCKTFYAEDLLRERTRVDGVLTVVDAVNFSTQLQRTRSDGSVNESAQQVAFADLLILNKVDLVDAEALAAVESEIRSINSVCAIIRSSLATGGAQDLPLEELLNMQSFNLDRVLRDLAEEPEEPVEPAVKRRKGAALRFIHTWRPRSRHDTGVATCAFTLTGAPLILDRFLQVMNTIRQEKAVDLYRYKGTVCVKESSGTIKRAVLQGVHDLCQFEPRGQWPEGEVMQSQIVFIGRDLNEDLWNRLFEKTKEGVLDER